MKSALALLQFALGIGLFLCAVMPAYPHGGGLDGYGCHNNRKAGGYHCHRGPLARAIVQLKGRDAQETFSREY